jgi:integrase
MTAKAPRQWGCIYRQAGRTIWMLKYYRDGRPVVESSHTDDERKAGKVLKQKEADIDRGLPVGPQVGRVRFEDAAKDVVRDYRVNGRRSLPELERRIKLHLAPFFAGRRLSTVTTADVREYTDKRQEAGASNAEINRELAVLKRAYTLAVQAGRLLHRPHIPMLEEHNVRIGFFEREQFEAVRKHLPEDLRDAAAFAYITGWRVPSEVLTLKWRQVDLAAKTVRLDPGSTKNDEGRLFPFGAMPDLESAIKSRRKATDAWQGAHGAICPWVFHRDGASLLDASGRPSKDFREDWKAACKAAGCPGKIPHDFRRTAVRNLVRAGVSEKTAMLLTGHKTRSVFDRYDIVNEADLRQAVSRLAMASASVKDNPAPRARRLHR